MMVRPETQWTSESHLVYLDAAASSPLAPEALKATIEALTLTGNPGAAHVSGHAAAGLVRTAREHVSALMRVGPAGVVFVASATEANNLAIRGIDVGLQRTELVTIKTEHPSVLNSALGREAGHDRTHVIGVHPSGEVDLDRLKKVLSSKTALVSIQAANNETGTIQPIEAVTELAHHVGALVHVDASQLMAWGEAPLLDECDMVTVSSHKMHGPQGAAALVARPSARHYLRAQVTGGGQEHGLRSGTLNVAAIAGFGAAAALSQLSGKEAAVRVADMRTRLLDGLIASIGDVIERGKGATRRLPGILNVGVGTGWPDSIETEALLARLPRIAASTGSACHAGTPEPSVVLVAMGLSAWEASRSIRLSLSRYSTSSDVELAIAELGRGYAEIVQIVGFPSSDERYSK